MESVSVRQLKNNPSTALRAARDSEFVVVTNRDTPEALLVAVERLGVPDIDRLRLALAIALFRDGIVSSGAAARMAGRPRAEMFALLARLGIPLYSAEHEMRVEDETATIDAWLSKARRRKT